jgi:hypothetical protein
MTTGALFVRRVIASRSNSIISFSHLLSGLIKNLEQGEASMSGEQPVEGNRVLPSQTNFLWTLSAVCCKTAGFLLPLWENSLHSGFKQKDPQLSPKLRNYQSSSDDQISQVHIFSLLFFSSKEKEIVLWAHHDACVCVCCASYIPSFDICKWDFTLCWR